MDAQFFSLHMLLEGRVGRAVLEYIANENNQ
jgi:hypothetical protein